MNIRKTWVVNVKQQSCGATARKENSWQQWPCKNDYRHTHMHTITFFFFYPCVMYYQSIKGHSCAAVPQQAAAAASKRRVYTLHNEIWTPTDSQRTQWRCQAAAASGRDLDREKLEPPLWPPVCFMRVCLRLPLLLLLLCAAGRDGMHDSPCGILLLHMT